MGFIHDWVEKEGHEVDYFCSEDLPTGFGGKCARFSFPFLVRSRAIAAARMNRPYDIINIHEPSAAGVLFRRTAFGSSAVVLMSHSPERRVWEDLLRESQLGRLKSGDLSLKTRMVYPLTSLSQSDLGFRYADHVFYRNSSDGEYIQRRFNVIPQKMTAVFAGADAIYAEVSQSRDYKSAEYLIFPGTWLPRKGTVDVVEAFSVLAERHHRLRLNIVGAGVPLERIKDDFDPKVRDRVTCSKSGASDDEHAAAFGASDIYVFPTLAEGGTLTLAEGMMSGLPIVTTNVCGMTDVIEHERNGLLVPARSPQAIVEAVERLIVDAELRERLGRTAQSDAIAKYNWRAVAQPVIETYERLCSAN